MSCHEGVSCDNCLKSNFSGKRFKCLICYDYDLCENCHSLSVATSRHLASHPMQCILTRNEFDKYYAGESISPESPPSFVCPFCAKLGYTETLLREHVVKQHEDVHKEVICPVCAALPSGDPNLVTEDLAHHLSMEHRVARDADESSSGRHIRRRGIRTRNHRSMHFSGGPIGTAMNSSSSLLSNNNSSSSLRDPMDPIAELLSQLSGVRRSAQQLQNNVNTASQLQDLQVQLQHERQRAAEIRQQLERFPNKMTPSGGPGQKSNPRTYADLVAAPKAQATLKKSTIPDDDDKFLLANLDNLELSEAEIEKQTQDEVDRSHFVQELLLDVLSEGGAAGDNVERDAATERAVPVQCAFSSASASNETKDFEHSPSDGPTLSNKKSGKSLERKESKDVITDAGGNKKDVQPSGYQQQPWRFANASVQINRDTDDEDRPPSPTPLQGHERLLQARVYVGGYPEATAQLGNYGREDVGSGNITKHVH